MVGQHDECVDGEGMISAHVVATASRKHAMVDEQGLLPLQQIDREEEASARNEGATIIRHVRENSTFV